MRIGGIAPRIVRLDRIDQRLIQVKPAEDALNHGIQGIGDGGDYLVDPDFIDEIVFIKTEDAVAKAKELSSNGLLVGISAGANVLAAEQIAKECGITEVVANVRPDEKAAYIASLKEQGKHVAMVGDGINDAAALAVADVGIAMGAGSDIALDSADIVLLRNDLMDAMSALELGRVTVKKIRTNLWWAFVYNIVGIPLAMGLLLPWTGWLLPPAYAAAAMSLSSVSVVMNSLTLKWWRPRQLEA